jgi:hypothetical protein
MSDPEEHGAVTVSPDELELVISSDPHNIPARVRLIKYYSSFRFRYNYELARIRHVTWMIEHQPHVQLGEHATISANAWPEQFAACRLLWEQAVERSPQEPLILWNALMFFVTEDSIAAEVLARRGSELEPSESRWHESLATILHARLYEATAPLPTDPTQEDNRVDVREGMQAEQAEQLLARQAADEYRRAIHLSPHSPHRHRMMAGLGRCALRARLFERAAHMGELIIAEMNEGNEGGHEGARASLLHYSDIMIGCYAVARGDLQMACSMLSSAIDRRPVFAAGLLFGPELTLAELLLLHGKRDQVIAFLLQCKKSWPYPRHIDSWCREILAGKTPRFRIDKFARP